MRSVYTVKQVNAYIKNIFTQDHTLHCIYIKGEVSNCKYHTSGHIYFSLKDESGTIACVMFAGQRGGLSFRMQDGQQVIVLGNVSVYERDGRYQVYANEILLDGAGLLYEAYEALKTELSEMGMFAPEYKQPIPRYAARIGVVTAPTGAAIRDIMNVAARRNPYVQLYLYPALVQGKDAAASIVKGIQMLDQRGVDVIIIGRGGGSIEDLWAFNERETARAIFDCRTPIISAVGHETDTTIADYVADLRAPTPSAAAEIAVCEYLLIQEQQQAYALRMKQLMLARIKSGRLILEQYAQTMKYLHPRNKRNEKRQWLQDTENQIRQAMQSALQRKQHKLAIYIERLKGLSPLEKLSRGYSFVEGADGKVVKSVADVKPREQIKIYVTDGVIQAEVWENVQGGMIWDKNSPS